MEVFYSNSCSKVSSNVDLIVSREAHLAKTNFNKRVFFWEHSPHHGEERSVFVDALRVRNAYDLSETSLVFVGSDMAEPPPMPPSVTWLEYWRCPNLDFTSQDLSQLTYLCISECPNAMTLPNKLSPTATLVVKKCPNLIVTPPALLAQLGTMQIDTDNAFLLKAIAQSSHNRF